MWYNKRNMKSEQRGTLIVEALAMLGLIAMVTPTLYKKSAERLFEIQDINVASQMRTMNNVIETFVKTRSGSLSNAIDESGNNVIRLCYGDNGADYNSNVENCFGEGYSAVVPYGFSFETIKNFNPPRVYLYKDRDVSSGSGNLLYYIVYDKVDDINIGSMRTSRLASLVGANGGIVEGNGENAIFKGTGGGWFLDKDNVTGDLGISDAVENSLVVTSSEPVVVQESEKQEYLYRVHDEGDANHMKNTMITDLYMGGSGQHTDGYIGAEENYYSIFNVRRLTLNTECGGSKINATSSCIPKIADLYIGKPERNFAKDVDEIPGQDGKYGRNTGAAWFYGNLSALNDNFRLFRSDDSSNTWERTNGGYDIMEFARIDSSHAEGDVDGHVNLSVFRADNDPTNAKVSMMNGFVEVAENVNFHGGSPSTAFMVGKYADDDENKGELLKAYYNQDTGGIGEVVLNTLKGSITDINPRGGNVLINSLLSEDQEEDQVEANTMINISGQGAVAMGALGEWFKAMGMLAESRVSILGTGDGIFTVGSDLGEDNSSDASDEGNMIWANNVKTSLRGDKLRVYENNPTGDLGKFGGTEILSRLSDNGGVASSGATVITTPYADILGKLYVGAGEIQSSSESDDGATFSRSAWQMGVAGSAWVDDMLWARRAWLKSGGMGELHAGHSSYNAFTGSTNTAWLNVYPGGGNPKGDGVIIRNAAKIKKPSERYYVSKDPYSDKDHDTLFMANSQGVEVFDPSGVAFARWQDGIVRIGAKTDSTVSKDGEEQNVANMLYADASSVAIQGRDTVDIFTVKPEASTGVVDIQNGAMKFAGSLEEDGTKKWNNHIVAEAGWFGVRSGNNSSWTSSEVDSEGEETHLRVGKGENNKAEVRVKYGDFAVRASEDSTYVDLARFYVRPDENPEAGDSKANIKMDGSLHVTGNKVLHIATNSSNVSDGSNADKQHAMFEIDPNFVQVMEINEDGSIVTSNVDDRLGKGNARAMFRVNPRDTSGNSIAEYSSAVDDPTANASVYVRKGAIELMKSESNGNPSTTYGADEGYGYIRANRFVSNTGEVVPQNKDSKHVVEGRYDQYMVNPAYTSVMHDIKLTTRGGARLSDILPDYILKGVYNVSNDFVEGSKTNRIKWSCGKQCDEDGPYNEVDRNVAWADPYVGVLPYAVCPPTYAQFATLVPTSFMMGITGNIQPTAQSGWGTSNGGSYFVDFRSPRQASILKVATSNGGRIMYPDMAEMKIANFKVADGAPEDFKNIIDSTLVAGWFRGVKAIDDRDGNIRGSMSEVNETLNNINHTAWVYEADGSSEVIAEPLYFQQNTWLKTSVVPKHTNAGTTGWAGYMGFVYDDNVWSSGDLGNEGLVSNNTSEGHNSEEAGATFQGYGEKTQFVWNLFPTPTNSIEGHGTVYCYFDRSLFDQGGWEELVDPIDQMNSYRNKDAGYAASKRDRDGGNSSYIDRLHDPSLKYNDPW